MGSTIWFVNLILLFYSADLLDGEKFCRLVSRVLVVSPFGNPEIPTAYFELTRHRSIKSKKKDRRWQKANFHVENEERERFRRILENDASSITQGIHRSLFLSLCQHQHSNHTTILIAILWHCPRWLRKDQAILTQALFSLDCSAS
jgi:hypothetical protein